MTEEHPLGAQSPYAASKIAADQMALAFHRSYGLPVLVLRPFNTYGPRQSSRAFIANVLVQVVSVQTQVRLGALEPTRDFSYVRDTARGFLAALEAAPAALGQVIQLGSGFEISMGAVLELIAELLDVELVIEQDPERLRPAASEVDRLWSDATRAAELLGWKPELMGVQGLRSGLQETLQWLKQPENLRRYRPEE